MTDKEKKKSPHEFMEKYKELCDEYGYTISVVPALKARDDGTWSIVLQTGIQQLKKDE